MHLVRVGETRGDEHGAIRQPVQELGLATVLIARELSASAASRGGTPSSTRLPLSRRSVTGALGCWAAATLARRSSARAGRREQRRGRRARCRVCMLLLWCPKRARRRKLVDAGTENHATSARHHCRRRGVCPAGSRGGALSSQQAGRAAFVDVGTTPFGALSAGRARSSSACRGRRSTTCS